MAAVDNRTWVEFDQNVTSNLHNETGLQQQLVLHGLFWPTVVNLSTDFPNIFLITLSLTVAATSSVFSYFVFIALLKADRYKLKSKILVSNVVVTDFLLPICYSFSVVPYIADAYGMPNNSARVCLDGLNAIFAPTAQYAQMLASFVLAVDRVYAVTCPMTYYAYGYPSCISTLILVGTWIISLSITGSMLIPGSRDEGLGICYRLAPQHKRYSQLVRFPFAISVSLLTFAAYVALFSVVRYQRSRLSHSARHTGHRPGDQKHMLSLVISYFLLHLTTLTLYLPGPLFALLQESGHMQLSKTSLLQVRRVLILLYMLNPIIDCIILSTRVEAIREHINIVSKRKANNQSGENVTTIDGIEFS